jgi:DNA polymerase-3 subunit alpha
MMILKERSNGEFIDFIDFTKRMYGTNVNKKVLVSLIIAGVFDCFGYNKKTLINNIDNILNYVELSKDAGLIEIEVPVIDLYEEYSKDELIKNELNTFGFYLTYHPVSKYKDNIYTNTLSLDDYVDKYIELVLEVNNIKEILTKKNDVMAFVKAGDEYKQIDLTLFPKIYNDNKNLENYDIIKVYGKVEKRFDNYQIIVSKIINLTRSNNEE